MSELKIDWWKKGFGKKYYQIFLQSLSSRTEGEIKFILGAIKPKKGQKVIDLGCGYGRHSIGLAKHNLDLTAVDYSAYLLKIGAKIAKERNSRVRFVRQDLRKLKTDKKYDVALSMFSSFGYFPHKENLNFLQKVYSLLKPGGKFLLDVMNAQMLFHEIRESGSLKDSTYVRVRTYSEKTAKYTDTDTYYLDTQLVYLLRKRKIGKQVDYWNYYMFHYTAKQLRKYLESIGFEMIDIWGGYSGERWNRYSWRTIILCQKPLQQKKSFWVNLIQNLKLAYRWPLFAS